jgi:hypothetical protein
MMREYRWYALLSFAAFVAAMLFFVMYHHMIVIYFPYGSAVALDNSAIIQKKQVTFYYFHGDKWKTEKQELLWTEHNEHNLLQLLNAWLMVIDEAHIITKKTAVQSVLITLAGDAYISFDHTIIGKEDTIFKKWMLVEGLLKTVALNDCKVQQVQLLVQHQHLSDPHLDFSALWPIHGFMN